MCVKFPYDTRKYYTLRDIPRFDESGLWSYRNIRFSRYGTVSGAALQMIERSAAGHTAKELSEVLNAEVGPELSRLYRLGRVPREKLGPVFVYLSGSETRRKAQRQAREAKWSASVEQAESPAPELVIAVLVELVHHPGTEPRALCRRLGRRGVPITEKQIQRIFTRYDLAGKRGR